MNERLSNSLLGYPDNARLLIINADDFGMCHSVNQAILGTVTEGVVSSTSVMATCPWAAHAMQMLREHPDIPFAVHLTLVSEFDVYRWGPVSSRDRVPSLVDKTGHFYQYHRIPELLEQARLDEVEAEFRAQIETVLGADLSPSHLDWHCLADGGRPDIFELTLGLAREYGLALRVHHLANAETCRRLGLPTVDHPVLDSYHMGFDDKSARYIRLLRELPAGLSEWAVHPSLGNDESRALEPDSWQVRRTDFDFFMSQEARDILDKEGIVLVNYQAL